MNVENTKAQMRKGVLEYCILSVLGQDELYPPDIITRLKEAKLIVVEGTLYPLLDRLKRDALVDASWVTEGDSRPRKYYQLTEQGQSKLQQMRAVWRQSVTDIEQLLTSPGPQALTMSQIRSQVPSPVSAPTAAHPTLNDVQPNQVDPQPQHSDGDAQ